LDREFDGGEFDGREFQNRTNDERAIEIPERLSNFMG
jgi:hypothetical protein